MLSTGQEGWDKFFWGILVFHGKMAAAEDWCKTEKLKDIPTKHLGLHRVQTEKLREISFFFPLSPTPHIRILVVLKVELGLPQQSLGHEHENYSDIRLLFLPMMPAYRIAENISVFFLYSQILVLQISLLPVILTTPQQPFPWPRWKCQEFQRDLCNVSSRQLLERNVHKTGYSIFIHNTPKL